GARAMEHVALEHISYQRPRRCEECLPDVPEQIGKLVSRVRRTQATLDRGLERPAACREGLLDLGARSLGRRSANFVELSLDIAEDRFARRREEIGEVRAGSQQREQRSKIMIAAEPALGEIVPTQPCGGGALGEVARQRHRARQEHGLADRRNREAVAKGGREREDERAPLTLTPA